MPLWWHELHEKGKRFWYIQRSDVSLFPKKIMMTLPFGGDLPHVSNDIRYERNDDRNAQSIIVIWSDEQTGSSQGVTNSKEKDCYCRCEKSKWFKTNKL